MNQLYQQLGQSKTPNFQAMVSKMLQNNPNLRPYMDMIKGGANPREMFYNLAKQKGVDPETFLAQFR